MRDRLTGDRLGLIPNTAFKGTEGTFNAILFDFIHSFNVPMEYSTAGDVWGVQTKVTPETSVPELVRRSRDVVSISQATLQQALRERVSRHIDVEHVGTDEASIKLAVSWYTSKDLGSIPLEVGVDDRGVFIEFKLDEWSSVFAPMERNRFRDIYLSRKTFSEKISHSTPGGDENHVLLFDMVLDQFIEFYQAMWADSGRYARTTPYHETSLSDDDCINLLSGTGHVFQAQTDGTITGLEYWRLADPAGGARFEFQLPGVTGTQAFEIHATPGMAETFWFNGEQVPGFTAVLEAYTTLHQATATARELGLTSHTTILESGVYETSITCKASDVNPLVFREVTVYAPHAADADFSLLLYDTTDPDSVHFIGSFTDGKTLERYFACLRATQDLSLGDGILLDGIDVDSTFHFDTNDGVSNLPDKNAPGALVHPENLNLRNPCRNTCSI